MDINTEIEKSFPKIEKLFKSIEVYIFLIMEEDELAGYHFSTGRWIRENLLSPKSRLYKMFIKEGITDKDEMSAEILVLFHRYLKKKNEPLNLKNFI